jgi:hypothetical protein
MGRERYTGGFHSGPRSELYAGTATSNPFFLSIGSILGSRPLKARYAAPGSSELPDEYMYLRALAAVSLSKGEPASMNASKPSASRTSAHT